MKQETAALQPAAPASNLPASRPNSIPNFIREYAETDGFVRSIAHQVINGREIAEAVALELVGDNSEMTAEDYQQWKADNADAIEATIRQTVQSPVYRDHASELVAGKDQQRLSHVPRGVVDD